MKGSEIERRQNCGFGMGPLRRRWWPNPAPDSSGFTLLELLVVIALLVILASLLLPALGRAKTSAHRIQCVNHLQQWVMAQKMYASDNDDYIARESFEPHGVTLNLWAQVRHPQAEDVWYNALARDALVSKASDYASTIIRPDFYNPRLLFHCPEARFPKRAGEDAVAFFSLAMNSKLILRADSTIKFPAIRNPSATVMFLDNRLPGEPKVDPAQPDWELGQPSAYANRFVVRHLGFGNLAFTDGHVEQRRGFEVVTDGLAHCPQTDLIWTADPQHNPNRD